MTGVDAHTRKVIGCLLRNGEARTMAISFTIELAKLDWKPKTCQSDNGSEFKGEFAEFAKLARMEQRKSRPYKPQVQGKCERVHDTLKQMMRAKTLDARENGETINLHYALAQAIHAYNTDEHESLGRGMSPNLMWNMSAQPERLEQDLLRRAANVVEKDRTQTLPTHSSSTRRSTNPLIWRRSSRRTKYCLGHRSRSTSGSRTTSRRHLHCQAAAATISTEPDDPAPTAGMEAGVADPAAFLRVQGAASKERAAVLLLARGPRRPRGAQQQALAQRSRFGGGSLAP
eukprot:TRINITY_DN7034_c0_g1_i4.p1 TRINITY_DN7034_c0_g1~~TRINITY_DN7034_c0_g1_i4.p1  ORF type:complete len:287 (-),score=20.95 TRINITY_DN7034_c0_g1_i4:28-888(-)